MLHYTFETKKCSRKFFMNRLVSIIKSPKVNGRYLSILVQFTTKDNDIVDLDTFFCLDRLNYKSILLCKFFFNLRYSDYMIDNKTEISSFIISYEEIEKNEYLESIKDFYKETL